MHFFFAVVAALAAHTLAISIPRQGGNVDLPVARDSTSEWTTWLFEAARY